MAKNNSKNMTPEQIKASAEFAAMFWEMRVGDAHKKRYIRKGVTKCQYIRLSVLGPKLPARSEDLAKFEPELQCGIDAVNSKSRPREIRAEYRAKIAALEEERDAELAKIADSSSCDTHTIEDALAPIAK